jgi:hypothetical protein
MQFAVNIFGTGGEMRAFAGIGSDLRDATALFKKAG